jgi:hypothetical protein
VVGELVAGIYDYQGRRVRTVTESNHQVQSQRNYLLSLDISTNQAKQQSRTLHIGTHILISYSTNSSALVIINIVLCGVGFVCFGELVKAIVVAPL